MTTDYTAERYWNRAALADPGWYTAGHHSTNANELGLSGNPTSMDSLPLLE